MPRKVKKKVQAMEDDPEVEVFTKVEIIYKDTKPLTGVDPKFIWGKIYQMIKDHTIPGVGLEDIPIYTNIKR